MNTLIKENKFESESGNGDTRVKCLNDVVRVGVSCQINSQLSFNINFIYVAI